MKDEEYYIDLVNNEYTPLEKETASVLYEVFECSNNIDVTKICELTAKLDRIIKENTLQSSFLTENSIKIVNKANNSIWTSILIQGLLNTYESKNKLYHIEMAVLYQNLLAQKDLNKVSNIGSKSKEYYLFLSYQNDLLEMISEAISKIENVNLAKPYMFELAISSEILYQYVINSVLFRSPDAELVMTELAYKVKRNQRRVLSVISDMNKEINLDWPICIFKESDLLVKYLSMKVEKLSDIATNRIKALEYFLTQSISNIEYQDILTIIDRECEIADQYANRAGMKDKDSIELFEKARHSYKQIIDLALKRNLKDKLSPIIYKSFLNYRNFITLEAKCCRIQESFKQSSKNNIGYSSRKISEIMNNHIFFKSFAGYLLLSLDTYTALEGEFYRDKRRNIIEPMKILVEIFENNYLNYQIFTTLKKENVSSNKKNLVLKNIEEVLGMNLLLMEKLLNHKVTHIQSWPVKQSDNIVYQDHSKNLSEIINEYQNRLKNYKENIVDLMRIKVRQQLKSLAEEQIEKEYQLQERINKAEESFKKLIDEERVEKLAKFEKRSKKKESVKSNKHNEVLKSSTKKARKNRLGQAIEKRQDIVKSEAEVLYEEALQLLSKSDYSKAKDLYHEALFKANESNEFRIVSKILSSIADCYRGYTLNDLKNLKNLKYDKFEDITENLYQAIKYHNKALDAIQLHISDKELVSLIPSIKLALEFIEKIIVNFEDFVNVYKQNLRNQRDYYKAKIIDERGESAWYKNKPYDERSDYAKNYQGSKQLLKDIENCKEEATIALKKLDDLMKSPIKDTSKWVDYIENPQFSQRSRSNSWPQDNEIIRQGRLKYDARKYDHVSRP